MSHLKSEKIFQEVVGLFLLAFTIFLIVSLVSYSKIDRSLNFKRGGQGATLKVSNYAGSLGAIAADLLVQFFGLTAFFIPVITLFLGLHIMCWRPIEKKWSAFFGAFFFIITTPSLISLIYPKEDLVLARFAMASSGWLGKAIVHNLLVPRLGSIGVVLLLVAIWLTSIMMMTRLSLLGALECIIKGLRWGGGLIGQLRIRGEGRVDNPVRSTVPEKAPQRPRTKKGKKQEPPTAAVEELQVESNRHQMLPPFNLLKKAERSPQKKAEMEREIESNSRLLESKLLDFGVQGRVVHVNPGPVITRYEFEPAPGIKINRISNLSDDLALAMKAQSVRIVAPIPGKSVVGLEIPNTHRETVVLRDILTSKEFRNINSKLSLALGKDIAGKPYVTNLARMPHLLVAGATGSGKSVSVNSIICSLLFNATSEEVKFIMIDPKRLELGVYNDIPHLLVPVVMEPKHAANALKWATEEMDQRYQILSEKGVRNIDQYNALIDSEAFDEEGERLEKLPYIVIVIDEFADLILMSGREVETLLTRLAQMARAVGIHLVIATQRPSVDIITGLIKANFPCRISFRVSSKTDSRTILDNNGAEKLLGMGDMLFLPPGVSNLVRVHGSSVTESEINALVDFLRQQAPPQYDTSIIEDRQGEGAEGGEGGDEYDELYDKAVNLVVSTNKASISMVQRRLRIGYNRAARMIELMERDGVVSKAEGGKPRQVLVRKEHETI